MDVQPAINWYINGRNSSASLYLSITRDMFRERLRRLRTDLEKQKFDLSSIALAVAVCGEIGNNAFDHNLGKWQDQPGCWFQHAQADATLEVVLADRGQGILNSLHTTFPNLSTEDQALSFAFEKRASGRAPERRGNGLKFVKAQIEARTGSSLIAFSSGASYKIGKNLSFNFSPPLGMGVFVFISWKL